MIEETHLLIHIKLHHEVSFGKAIYILGNRNQLGNWKPGVETRLDWSQNNDWRITIALPKKSQLEYKYVIANYKDPWNGEMEWQTGGNRVLNLLKVNQNQAYLNEKWNTLRFKIILYTPSQFQQLFICGNCPDLGMKVSRIKMSEEKEQTYQNVDNQKAWSIEFDSSKHKKIINYYYFSKINGVLKSVREPGKHFYTESYIGQNLIGRIDIEHLTGKTIIVESEDFKGFKITKLSEQIFIGPYIKNMDDIAVLSESGVKAILSLQTVEDMEKYGVDWVAIKEQMSEYGIESFNYQIIDMNFADFIKKAAEALKLLRTVLIKYHCVYVHCTAGVFRSPQLVILYLVKFCNYNLNEAVQLIKSKRPFVHPYIDGMRNLLNNVYAQFKIRRL